MLVALFVLSVGAVNSGFSMEHFVKVVYQQKMRESVGELNECKLCLDVVDNVINDVLNIFLSEFLSKMLLHRFNTNYIYEFPWNLQGNFNNVKKLSKYYFFIYY